MEKLCWESQSEKDTSPKRTKAQIMWRGEKEDKQLSFQNLSAIDAAENL